MKRALILLTLFCAIGARADDNRRRDGNWWHEQSVVTKYAYMTGFFDGMDLGEEFSYWGNRDETCTGKAVSSAAEYEKKYINHVTNDQLADGLDSFYKDYRNRSIRVQDAVWLVLNGIAGKPKSELDTMIEKWRQSAQEQ